MSKAPVIEMVDPGALVPYENNSRTHDAAQIAQLVRSIREFGFTVPVLIDAENVLIAGHGRVQAATQMGLKEIPAIRLTHLSDEQRRAYVIADNKLTELGGWDEQQLTAEILALSGLDYDLALTGFDEKEVERLLMEKQEGETDPEEEWDGMPAFSQGDKLAFRTVYVHFREQADVDAFAALLDQQLTPKTKFLWYPKDDRENLTSRVYD